MGMYPIDCPSCNRPFLWFSGLNDQSCSECQKGFEMAKETMSEITGKPASPTDEGRCLTNEWLMKADRDLIKCQEERDRYRVALEEIHAFWLNIDTHKPYAIGDMCERALAEQIKQSKGE